MSYRWSPVLRPCQSNSAKFLQREEVFDHPLKSQVLIVTDVKLGSRRRGGSVATSGTSSPGTPKSKSSASVLSSFPDPLSAAVSSIADPLSSGDVVPMDPLSKMSSELTLYERTTPTAVKATGDEEDGFEPWSARKSGILNKFITSDKLSIATSFLPGGDKLVIKPLVTGSLHEKVRNRLEQLDDFEEGSVREWLNLTQAEYSAHIGELNRTLLEAWEQDQRVKALKIVIQCSKLLVETNGVQFYPSKFVLISDILDTFGRLVYDRIRTKAEYYAPGSRYPSHLPENFTLDMVPESAKETCRNWFFKIASVRELVPRLYVEMAVLRSYNFITTGEFKNALSRLTKMIRGIGDPLVSVYARCYLCRVGMAVARENREYLYDNLYDFLITYNQSSVAVLSELNRHKIDLASYSTVYSPAFDWIVKCIAYRASEKDFVMLLDKCREQGNSGLFLNSILTSFKPEFISSRALEFVEILRQPDNTGYPKNLLFRALGLCLVVSDAPEMDRLQILNDIWKVVTKFKNPSNYMSCAEVWIEFPVKHFSKREVNTFLGDIIKHVTPDRAFEQHYPQLQGVIDRVLRNQQTPDDFFSFLSMDKLLPYLDLFQKESIKVDVCKMIMDAFVRVPNMEPINDPVVVNALMFICRIMHDSLNALISGEERKFIGSLICGFVRHVDYVRDFEQQLSFYVDCRAAFCNLEPVLVYLVQCVNQLTMKTRGVVKGFHTRKTASFVRACAAFCFITIPSLIGVFSRLDLYLLSGEVALVNLCLGQADACFKAAISLIPEVPPTIEIDAKHRSSEPYLIAYIQKFLSTLLIVPDCPDQGVLYLLRGLLNVLNDYTWDQNSDARGYVYISVLKLLAAMSQDVFPYHAEKVDSNDTLYGSDEKFLDEVHSIGQTILDEILQHLSFLGENEFFKRQAQLAMELFNHLLVSSDVGKPNTFTLVSNLWSLAHKHKQIDRKITMSELEFVRCKGQGVDGRRYGELWIKMQSVVKS